MHGEFFPLDPFLPLDFGYKLVPNLFLGVDHFALGNLNTYMT